MVGKGEEGPEDGFYELDWMRLHSMRSTFPSDPSGTVL